MRALVATLAFALLAFSMPGRAQDRTYGDFDCTVDCSGHAAGYKWADKKDIQDEVDCPDGNSQSFHEGCVAYTQDNARVDPDEDDDGQAVGDGRSSSPDADDDDDK
jgi:hypothetical protein